MDTFQKTIQDCIRRLKASIELTSETGVILVNDVIKELGKINGQ